MMNRFVIFLALVAGLSASTFYSSENKSILSSIAPISLGFFIGLLVAETPIASQLQEALGLTSRHPDKVGLDILHSAGTMDSAEAKSELNQRVMYGLQHAFLNLEITGWWFNMGLWDKTKPMRFQDACKAMVEAVTSHLDINHESHILDVGFGCGDQDVYMAQLYKPAHITGITIEPIQHHAAHQLIKRTGTPGTDIQLHVADASNLPQFLQSTPSVFSHTKNKSDHQFTHVVSIDSAYHYNTRAQFLKNAAQVLVPGSGRLALADMILAKPAPTSMLGRYIFDNVLKGIEVPVTNMKIMEEYKKDLEDAGFIDIEIITVEDRVFSGLAQHIQEQTDRFGGMMKPGVNWTYWGLCKGLRWLDRSGWLHFVIVKARNGPRPS
ncbi:hypothetical protein BGZ76_001766 [Entomortierella beljakovae]|nr:hypothetical protein BGZ76_001766 [Entomortierella beljakovae]